MNCKLIGSYIQHLEVTLEPAERFYAERGALIYHDEGIEAESTMNSGSLGGLIGAHISGEALMSVAYLNRSGKPRKLVIGGSHTLQPVKLGGLELICRRGAFVASSDRVEVSAKASVNSLIGGMGLFMQRIRGNATVFLDSRGQPIVVELNHGEQITIDENHVVALHGISEERISSKWSLRNLFRGEGISVLNVTGPGKVYISPGRVAASAT